MFAFMHSFQTIRRLEHEVTELRTQLATEKSVHGCRAISLMTPRLHHAEQTAQTIKHRCQRFQQADVHYAAPLASEQALHELRKIGVELSRNAGHTRALAMTTALEEAHIHQEPSGLPAIVSDIQHLADHTQHLGHQLDHWIEQVAILLKEDARVQAHQRETSTALANAAQAAEQVIEQLMDQARHMYKVIHHSTTTACLHAAKLEHAVWKSRIYHQLLSAYFEDHMVDHQHCTLGRWYFTGEGRRYKHMEEASVALAKRLDQLMEQAVYEIPMSASHPSPLADAP